MTERTPSGAPAPRGTDDGATPSGSLHGPAPGAGPARDRRARDRHGAGVARGRRTSSPQTHADDRRRTFPALPTLTGDEIARSWWAEAWVRALEESALDPARLARGRDYAGTGRVDAITVTPGRVTAYVHGGRPRPYRTGIRLRTLSDDAWSALLTVAASRPEYIAALLDRDVPQALADAADLLPTTGDLVPDCTCPDAGHPCKHAAALCYQTARLLDGDPFLLFLLRGMGESAVLGEIARRHTIGSAAACAAGAGVAALPTVSAQTALTRQVGALPPPFPPPREPGRPPVYPAAPEAPDPLALDLLASEAVLRARALLTTGEDPFGSLTVWQDAVRLAAAHPGSGLTASTRSLYRDLAGATGRTPTELARAVAAWRQGGPAALEVLEAAWDPPAGPFDRARPALTAAGFPHFKPWRNRLSAPTHQLRFGRDGLWYGYESDAGGTEWWPRGAPHTDPVRAATVLREG
ncbi:SWIM zinc finger family protein [Streptomyces sp. NPDC057638]|uniref:SWIM zinc finger family protein n=1 Tax=Streptomyces sp. NPDC057638 TaxID=3346190 RepID=UPI003687A8E3